MQLGFHSILFQHYALRRCPLHGEALTTRCPRCQAESHPTFSSIAANPFACKACGELWLSTVASVHRDEYLRLVGAMLEDRKRDLVQATAASDRKPGTCEFEGKLILTSPDSANSAAYGRHVARWTAWPQTPSSRWPTFPGDRYTLVDWQADGASAWPRPGPLTRQTATACLRALSHLCCVEGHAGDSAMLRSRLSMSPRGMRLNDRASIVSVALHATMCVYGTNSRSPIMAVQAFNGGAGVYGDIEWNELQVGRRLMSSDAGNAQLLKAEILGWFCACIVDTSSLMYLTQIEWQHDFPLTLFLPAWIVTGPNPHYALCIRERVSDRSLLRFLRRYPPSARLFERERWDRKVRRGHLSRTGPTPTGPGGASCPAPSVKSSMRSSRPVA
jgi:hypothetical protein